MALVASAQSTAAVVGFIPQAYHWVKLRQPISDYSGDEALLLCEESTDHWLAWIPDHGQAHLTRDQLLLS